MVYYIFVLHFGVRRGKTFAFEELQFGDDLKQKVLSGIWGIEFRIWNWDVKIPRMTQF